MITVVHLYPRELGINGDVGNVLALTKRAQWRGMSVTVVDHEVRAELPREAHFVHIGSGPASGQDLVRADLAGIAPTLRRWADDGIPFLAIAGGWQLLGRTLTDADGHQSEGVGVFPTHSTLTSARSVDEVYGSSELGPVAGFENHGSAFTSDVPDSTIATDRGVVFGNRVATNLHGPFLPMNPAWADWLLERAARAAGVSMGDDDGRCAVADEFAAKSRAAVRARLGL